MAHGFLTEAGLGRYYTLKTDEGRPVGAVLSSSNAVLASLTESATSHADGTSSLTVGFAGIHCAACVWVIETLFRRREGAKHIVLNPVRGSARLLVDDTFDLAAFADDTATIGYRIVAPSDVGAQSDHALLIRVGITSALAMNVMVLSLSSYFGLEDDPGLISSTFVWVSFALATLAFVVGGPVFIRGALNGLAKGVAPLDLPIATGMILAYAGSAIALVVGVKNGVYFDTVTTFIALMVAGRFVQQRAIEKNRRFLEAPSAVAHLRIDRVNDDGTLSAIPLASICEGDVVVVAPGELAPVDGELLTAADAVSHAFITGEPGVRSHDVFDSIRAGAKNEGTQVFRLRASTTYESSGLERLLRTADEPDEAARTAPFVRALSKVYVVAVAVVATGAGLVWTVVDSSRALDVTVAILVVTCPCALGLAAPLSAELGLSRLRGIGVYARRISALHRLLDVGTVIFDKTGTLTLTTPVVTNVAVVDDLAPAAKTALAQMVMCSRHPKSVALRAHLPSAALGANVRVTETAGHGLEFVDVKGIYRLGRGEQSGSVAFTKDGATLATFAFDEEPRPSLALALSGLKTRGISVRIMSGDDDHRVKQFAARVGIDVALADGGLTPGDKARRVQALSAQNPLFVGDGINDGLALEVAHVAVTPATVFPSVSHRSDLFTLADEVTPVSSMIDVAHRVRRTQNRNVVFAVLYNLTAVSLAASGHMSPLMAAVLMPLSGLVTIVHTTWSLRESAPTRASILPLSSSSTFAEVNP